MHAATDHKATPSSIPAAAAVATHEVKDYAAWKKVFDGHAATRTRSGILGTHINRAADNPNLVSVYLAAKDAASLAAFFGSEDLKATMQNAGVQGAPSIAFVTPVEDVVVRDRPLPAAIAKLRVADYGTWKKAFDAHAATRAKAGIVGHAINRAVDDPSVVVVYLQANSIDPLKVFLASQDLKDTMAKAGVQGAPQIAVVQGAEWGP